VEDTHFLFYSWMPANSILRLAVVCGRHCTLEQEHGISPSAGMNAIAQLCKQALGFSFVAIVIGLQSSAKGNQMS